MHLSRKIFYLFLRIYANRTSTEVSSCKLNMRFFGLNLSFVSFESSRSSNKVVTEGQGPEISPMVTMSMTPSYFERKQKQKKNIKNSLADHFPPTN